MERDLLLRVDIVPPEASGVHALMPVSTRAIRDVRELTAALLAQPREWALYAELLARPRERA